jgi:hypothetical protein
LSAFLKVDFYKKLMMPIMINNFSIEKPLITIKCIKESEALRSLGEVEPAD